jgi:hypothetical protein
MTILNRWVGGKSKWGRGIWTDERTL